MDYDIVIAGAGAAGLCAAIEAAHTGVSVLVIERMDKPAKKILATGNGKCNYTNKIMNEGCYRGRKSFIEAFLALCPWEDTVDFFMQLGIYPKERDGYFYPNSEQAASVAEVLLMKCAQLRVKIALSETVTKATATQAGFIIQTDKRRIKARAFVLTTGGKAQPKLGSDGSGYSLAKNFGHKIVPVVPALCSLKCDGLLGMKPQKFWKQTAGVRADAKVTLYIDDRAAASDTGQVQLTAYGISGIPVFQISRYAAYALKDSKCVSAAVDFFPKLGEDKLLLLLKKRADTAKEKDMTQFFTGLINNKLVPVFLKMAGIRGDMPAAALKNEDLLRLAGAMKHFETTAVSVNSFDEAQVCAGGVDTAQVDVQTMASKCVSGLYIAGELLDVDGICGGYNLHFAFQSGRLAGRHAAETVRGKKLC